MSIRKFFRKKSENPNKKQSFDDFATAQDQTESLEYLVEYEKTKRTFLPPVDYDDPDNIARYSSPRNIYETAITRIYETYPYDGTLAEKLNWLRMSSYLERHVFENEYPRNNGHIKFSASAADPAAAATGWGNRNPDVSLSTDLYGMPAAVENIEIKGGPHSYINPDFESRNKDRFNLSKGSNVFTWDDESSDWLSMRKSNLYSSGVEGNTVEFWFKRDLDSYDSTNNTKREVIFDMWNGVTTLDDGVTPNGNYGRFRIEYAEERDMTTVSLQEYPVFYLTYIGPQENLDNPANTVARGVIDCPLDFVSRRATTFYNDWHHIAISVQNSGNNLEVKFHLDGAVVETRTALGQAVAVLPAPHVANIGALRTGHEIEQMIDNQWLSVVASQVNPVTIEEIIESCAGGQRRGNHTVVLSITPNPAWPFVSGTHRDITTGPLADDGVSFRRTLDENAVHYTVRVFGKEVEELPWVPIAEREPMCRLDEIDNNTGFIHPNGPWNAGPFPDPADPNNPAEDWIEMLSRAQGLIQYTGNQIWVDGNPPSSGTGVYAGHIANQNGNRAGAQNWVSGPVPQTLVVTFDQAVGGDPAPGCAAGPLRTFPNGQFKFLVEVRNPLGVILGSVESNVIQASCPQFP